MSVSSIQWVRASDGAVPHGAFPAGKAENGETTYIARIASPHFQHGTLGVLIPSSRVVKFTFSGREHSCTEYEVLTCSDPEALYWKVLCHGKLPRNALSCLPGVSVGRTCIKLKEGRPVSGLYGSSHLQPNPDFEGPLVGKIIPSHHLYPRLHVPYKGYEFVFSTYSTLCAYGIQQLPHAEHGAVSWVQASGDNLPPNALQVSTTVSGEDVYIGRATHLQLLGPVIPSTGQLHVCWGNRYSQYEVLVVEDPAAFHWVLASHGDVPASAVAGGEDNGETVYIGRTVTGCDLLVGKTRRGVPIQSSTGVNGSTHLVGTVCCSRRALYAPYNGREYIYPEYEVLTSKATPKRLTELCRNAVLMATKGIARRIGLLPLPPHLVEFCKLRAGELEGNG